MWSSIVNMDWSLPCTERFQYRSRLVLFNRPAWMFQTSACMLSRQQSLVEAWEWHIRVRERFVAPNFQRQKNPNGPLWISTDRDYSQSTTVSFFQSLNLHKRVFLHRHLLENGLTWEYSTRRAGRSVKMDRKRGTLLQFVGSVLTLICGGTQYDALKCERVSISRGGTSDVRARRREAAPSRVCRPRLDWQAALTPW